MSAGQREVISVTKQATGSRPKMDGQVHVNLNQISYIDDDTRDGRAHVYFGPPSNSKKLQVHRTSVNRLVKAFHGVDGDEWVPE